VVRNQRSVIRVYFFSSNRDGPPKRPLARVIPQTAFRVLDAPGLVDDFYIHPVDWSSRNVIAVALSGDVHLFDATDGRSFPLFSLPSGHVTSLKWTAEGSHISVGTSHGELQIWDSTQRKLLRSLKGHDGRVGAVAWHDHILSSGASDAEIHHHDVRVRDALVGNLKGHEDLVCGLDYNEDGVLASGGNDNTVCIWESRMQERPLHTLVQHRAAAKAVKWCPWQRNLLASGGGSADRQICIWNASSGRLAKSVDAESQVTDIVWALQDKELVTAHGYSRNQLSVWNLHSPSLSPSVPSTLPSLTKSADLEGHTGRILGLAQSPDGALVASASADETLRFWQIFTPAAGEKKKSDRYENSTPRLRSIR